METLACGHAGFAGGSRVCPHLIRPAERRDAEYLRLLTGEGLTADLACTACDVEPPAWETICEDCVALYDAGETGYLFGWRGEPGIRERPETFAGTKSASRLPERQVLDFTGLPSADGRSLWLVLTRSGRLLRHDAGSGTSTLIRKRIRADRVTRRARTLPRLRLHTSPDGRYAAIVNDYGRTGHVIDLDTGRPALTFDGGDFDHERVELSAAFTMHEDRAVLVHRTAGTRLDVSDAATGRLLTSRDQDQGYGYFHGALYVSPGGDRIADDGWVPGPTGVPCVWDLRRWLDGNVFEADGGPTRRTLCRHEFGWRGPVCWIGDDLLAVYGIGRPIIEHLPGVRVFSAVNGELVHAFAGPRGDLFASDRHLYAAGCDGLTIWDPHTGERLGSVPGFVPSRRHPTTGELAGLDDGFLIRWTPG
ncbi:hypothetical protein KZ829_27860 [Actinoplanes hulinensis]|uniref:Uncharacterized protein n=1 Tax=Actinoplanes hulinensis TaxID=1144547 RepID=A0ABS7B9C5_9ACTN|nr:hypothetical protein [Actinoplanes hulinensis]MBW6437555.1 hypothetical protein [Actinoplanes hulinensis]